MNFRQLEVFEAVMRTGSLSAAARALGVSQPAVSKSLRLTEQSAGLVLFRRTRGRLYPSPEAEALLPEVVRMREEMRGVTTLIQQLREGTRGQPHDRLRRVGRAEPRHARARALSSRAAADPHRGADHAHHAGRRLGRAQRSRLRPHPPARRQSLPRRRGDLRDAGRVRAAAQAPAGGAPDADRARPAATCRSSASARTPTSAFCCGARSPTAAGRRREPDIVINQSRQAHRSRARRCGRGDRGPVLAARRRPRSPSRRCRSVRRFRTGCASSAAASGRARSSARISHACCRKSFASARPARR